VQNAYSGGFKSLVATLVQCIFVTYSLWECIGVVKSESQGIEIPELTALAKTKFCSLNLFSLLYPQIQKNKHDISLKDGIALMSESVF
jgi:hypothetical protein